MKLVSITSIFSLIESLITFRMSSGGGGQSTNTIQNSDPWAGQQPYLKDVMSQAQQQFNTNDQQYYQGNTLAPLSSQTQQALNLTQQRATAGSTMLNSAKDLNQNTINGDYLNSNPWMDANYDKAAGAVTRNYREAISPGIDSKFAQAGRYGSGMYQNMQDTAQENLGTTLDGMASTMYGNNYANERANQINAGTNAQAYAESDYGDIAKLAAVGGAYDTQAQNQINADRAKWDYEQNYDASKLNQYNGIINGMGNLGGTKSSSSIGPSQTGGVGGALSGAVGGALQGYGLYNAATAATAAGTAAAGGGATAAAAGSMNPWLMGGAALGGLLGWF